MEPTGNKMETEAEQQQNSDSSTSSENDNLTIINYNTSNQENQFKWSSENSPKVVKYSSRDNGPFVVFAKRDNIKIVSLAKELKLAGLQNIQNIIKLNVNLAKIMFLDKFQANKAIEIQNIVKHELFIPAMYTTTYGVIKEIETDILIEELN